MEIALAAVAISLVALMLSFYASYSFREFRRGLPGGQEWSSELHEHQYSKMFADGAGWRCGVCGMPKEKEK